MRPDKFDECCPYTVLFPCGRCRETNRVFYSLYFLEVHFFLKSHLIQLLYLSLSSSTIFIQKGKGMYILSFVSHTYKKDSLGLKQKYTLTLR